MDDMVTRWEAEMAEQLRSSMLQHKVYKSRQAGSNQLRPTYSNHLQDDVHPLPEQELIVSTLRQLTKRKEPDRQVMAELRMIYQTTGTLRGKLCAITLVGRSYLRRVQAERLARHSSNPLVRSLNKAVLWERRHGELVSMLRPT